MIQQKTMKRLRGLVAVLAIALLLPSIAEAKWSKACSKFSCDGVSVEVTDRHEWVGHLMDTYGYTTYRNGNDEAVTVNWRCYGVLKKGGKLVMCNDDSFVLAPKEVRKEVYSYHGGRFTHKDFSKYVVSIEVKKEKAPAVTPPATGKTKVNDANADEVYEDLAKRIKGNVTQQDYSDCFDWLNYMLKNKIGPLSLKMQAYHQSGKDTAPLREENEEMAAHWRNILQFVATAHNDGKLSPENEEKWEAFADAAREYSF